MVRIGCVLVCGLSLAGAARAADEPAFCAPGRFKGYEVSYKSTEAKPARLHAYRLGSVIFAGMAIGDSGPTRVAAVASEFAHASAALPADPRYCTWYYGEENASAGNAFHHIVLPYPQDYPNAEEVAGLFDHLLDPTFSQDPISLLSCARDHGYIGLGCDGQAHRGPSAFAMILAYAGCTPAHAAAIVDSVWGNNGVPTATRVVIAQHGAALAAANPAASQALRALFEGQASTLGP